MWSKHYDYLVIKGVDRSNMDPYLSYIVLTQDLTMSGSDAKASSPWGYIILLFVLIGINAFFAASELAVVSLNDAKLEKMAKDGDKKAKLLYAMTQKPTTFLATIQIGVTLSGFLASAIAADTFVDMLVAWLIPMNISWISESWLRPVGIVVITMLLTFLTLIFGELVPKRAAMKDSEKVAFACANPLHVTYKILKPLVWLVSRCTNGVAHMLGIKDSDGSEEYSEEEIKIMVDAGNEKGLIDSEAKDMINNVFEFDDRTVAEIMTHRTDMTALEIHDSLETSLKTFDEYGYSRLPVYSKDIDNIVGILYVKDLLDCFIGNKAKSFHIKNYMRAPLFVYETTKCDELFSSFQHKKVQIAIVLDEYGGTFGVVTMEDLLESIVGNIQDEFDEEEEEITKGNDGSYIVDGGTLIEDVSEIVGQPLDDSENDTIGGLVIDVLGYVPSPKAHPSVTIGKVKFTIIKMDEQSVDKIKVEKIKPVSNPDESKNEKKNDH